MRCRVRCRPRAEPREIHHAVGAWPCDSGHAFQIAHQYHVPLIDAWVEGLKWEAQSNGIIIPVCSSIIGDLLF